MSGLVQPGEATKTWRYREPAPRWQLSISSMPTGRP